MATFALLLLLSTVDGHVVLEGDPLPGVTVTMVDSAGRRQIAVTDVDGHYAFKNVAPGPYKLNAEMAGLRIKKQRGTKLMMRSDNTISTWIVTVPVPPDGPHYTYPGPGMQKALDLAPGIH